MNRITLTGTLFLIFEMEVAAQSDSVRSDYIFDNVAQVCATDKELISIQNTNVQIRIEDIPSLYGASYQSSLNLLPYSWVKSIKLDREVPNVAEGNDGAMGQININLKNPREMNGIHASAYLDSQLKQQVDADGAYHLTDIISASLMLHFENRQHEYDGNGDGFLDIPRTRQYNALFRIGYETPKWKGLISTNAVKDTQISGQCRNDMADPLYTMMIRNERFDALWKNDFVIDHEIEALVSVLMQGSWHCSMNRFGNSQYDVTQKTNYAKAQISANITEKHNICLGASFNFDRFVEYTNMNTSLESGSMSLEKLGMEYKKVKPLEGGNKYDTTTGIFLQYSYTLADKLAVVAGLRTDVSNNYGRSYTPRLNVMYSPNRIFTLHGSIGKGYHAPHAMAENSRYLADGRTVYVEDDIKQEESLNCNVSATFNIPVKKRNLEVNVEYDYTNFYHQLVVNVDGSRGLHTISFENLKGKSYSHIFHINASYPLFNGFSATGAFQINDAKCTYDGVLRQKPFTSHYNGLLNLSYTTPKKQWIFDITGQLYGNGEMNDHTDYPAYFQLQAQVKREFKHFSVYVGGKNLTNYKIGNPIINASEPWSPSFDATNIYGPTSGAMVYVGIRMKFLE